MADVRAAARKRSRPSGKLRIRWAQPFPRTGGVLDAHTERSARRAGCEQLCSGTAARQGQRQQHLNCSNIQRISPRASGPPNGPLGCLRWGWHRSFTLTNRCRASTRRFFWAAGLGSKHHLHIDAGAAASKQRELARSRARKSKGAMLALALQPGGPLGGGECPRRDPRGLLKQFKCSCSCRSNAVAVPNNEVRRDDPPDPKHKARAPESAGPRRVLPPRS